MDENKNINAELKNININLWITANAGSGKTSQLVNRYLLLLNNHFKPEEIVCITYTEAGASEMKQRILQSAKYNLDIKPQQLRISTIHSFCKQLLTANNLLPKDVNILNSNQYTIDKIISKIINNLQTINMEDNNFIKALIKNIANNENLYTFYQIIEQIIKNQLKFLSLFSLISDKTLKYNNILDVIDTANIPKLLPQQLQNLAYNQQTLCDKRERLRKELQSQNENALYAIAEKIVGSAGKKKLDFFKNENGIIDKDKIKKLDIWKDIVFTSKNEPRKSLNKYGTNLILNIKDYYIESMRQVGVDMTLSMLHLAYYVLQQYQQIKNEMKVSTYDDLLFYTLQALKCGQLALSPQNNINHRIKHLMLDEAQDTNPISWRIIEHIIEKTNCQFFVVGDKKQSIYRFQGARIEEYEKHKTRFENLSKIQGKPFSDNVKLNTSFRSIQTILDEVDDFCNDNLNKHAFTSYDNEIIKHTACDEKLTKQPHGFILNKENAIFLETFNIEDAEESFNEDGIKNKTHLQKNKWLIKTQDLINKQAERQKKIHKIATKLYDFILKHHQDIKNQIIDGASLSNSVAVIYPRGTTQGNFVFDLIKEMKQYNDIQIIIKANLEMQNLYFLDIISLIKFYILQNDDMNLACLLKSQIFNFTDNDLKMICQSGNKFSINKTLWQALKSQIFTDDKINQKINFAVNSLKKIINCETLTDLINLTETLISSNLCQNNTTYEKYSHPLEIIKVLIDKNKPQYDYNARAFLLSLQESDIDNVDVNITSQKNQNSNNTKVLFSTIHGVKGMEFDSVILFELKQKKHAHQEKMMFFENYFWYKTSSCKIQKDDAMCDDLLTDIEQQEQQDKNEALRLKYVAMTRAKRRLMLFEEN